MNIEIISITKQAKSILSNYSNQEAEQLLFIIYQEVLALERTTVLAYPETKVPNSDYKRIMEIVERLKKNEPIQYIIGKTEFYDLNFEVAPAVLIPRPETEELVHWIISDNSFGNTKLLDIGTGSGCIAISLAKNIVNSTICAVDVSADAINIAKKNAQLNKVEISFLQHDILQVDYSCLPKDLNIIVSNPPYVTNEQKKAMQKNVLDYEPALALFVPDNDPLLFYRRIAEIGMDLLVNNGALYFEINEEYGNELKSLLLEIGYSNVFLKADINGKHRMIKAKR